MIGELLKIAGQCDGVRCDMAMLVCRTSSSAPGASRPRRFWPKATRRVRERVPGLLLHGRGLLGPGMDAAAAGIRLHLRQAAVRPPPRRARPAGARASSTRDWTTRTSWPASWRTTTSRGRPPRSLPESTRPRRSSRSCPRAAFLPPRPVRGADETHLAASRAGARTNPSIRSWRSSTTGCSHVLRQPAVRDGQWQLLECVPAWEGNWTWDCFLAFAWQGPGGERLLVAVNYRSQPEPVLRPAAVRRPGRSPVATAGPDRRCALRPRRR